jgi:Uma2 family endonuclease
MSTATVGKKLMTAEEFLALPDDGVERWLIRGELREKRDTDMTMRNKVHSITEGHVTGLLWMWLRGQSEPRGAVVCGEAGFLLRRTPATITAGVDVAVITAEQADVKAPDTALAEGPPLLIAEILSPYDKTEEVVERVEEYLTCGVPQVWVLNPYFKTITIHRPGQDPAALDATDTITGDPELPGFSAPVADFFR